MTQAAARAMIKGGRGGRVLHISSVRGQLGINAGYLAYVAAKGAINAVTRQQATEWAKYGINVNAIAPTFVSTPQVASLLADEKFKAGLLARIPLNRIAETDDLVGAVLFFCSDASGFVHRPDPDPRRRPDGDPMSFDPVTPNVFTDTTIRGCNPSYVVTSDGTVVVDTPQMPSEGRRHARAKPSRAGPSST